MPSVGGIAKEVSYSKFISLENLDVIYVSSQSGSPITFINDLGNLKGCL